MTELSDEVARWATTMVKRKLGQGETRTAAHQSGWSAEMWDAAAEAGWFDLLLDEGAGGLGLDTGTIISIFALIGRELVPGPFLDHMVALPLLYPHAPTGIVTHLDQARSGSRIVALADPEACGSHPRAHASIEIDNRLSGCVPLVRYAQKADAFFVICGRGTLTDVVYLPASTTGLRIESRTTFDPTFPVGDLLIEGVKVSSEQILDRGGTRSIHQTVIALRSMARHVVAAELAGLTRHLLDASVNYVKQRYQFGRPVGSFQPVQQILADMTLDVIGLEAYTDDLASATSSRDDLNDLDMIALKGFAARAARRVGEAALQVHGGIAFTAEFELHRWFMRVLSLQGLYGDDLESFLSAGQSLVTDATSP